MDDTSPLGTQAGLGVQDTRSAAGMTLRDYFAAAALTGLLADPNVTIDKPDEVAEDAYTLADALLAARDRQR